MALERSVYPTGWAMTEADLAAYIADETRAGRMTKAQGREFQAA